MGSPTTSVIVPVRDRFDLLRLALEALGRQTYRDFEVIVIDDGSSGNVREVVEDFSSLDITVLRTEGVGAVEARCRGIDVARGSVLAFTDSDCEPEPQWLDEAMAHIDAGADVVQGVTMPARPARLLERTLSYRGGEGLFATCNMLYRRDAYERAGGFDRGASGRWRFRPDEHSQGLGFGEDVLLGWRVSRTGRMAVAEKAVVRHAVMQPPLRELFSRSWQVGAFPALIREIPELRRTLLRSRVFLQTKDRVPFYVAVAAALVGALPVSFVALGWWAANVAKRVLRFWDEPKWKRAAVFPIELALDATAALALIVGSVRARTPVL
jgi:glycosyltransferase involved in cell wall biosynthesis